MTGQLVEQIHLGRPLDERKRVLAELKPETQFEPDRPEHAGGVLHEAEAVEHADDFLFEIALPAVEIDQLAEGSRVEPDRQRVDRKIPPVEILLDGALLDSRE